MNFIDKLTATQKTYTFIIFIIMTTISFNVYFAKAADVDALADMQHNATVDRQVERYEDKIIYMKERFADDALPLPRSIEIRIEEYEVKIEEWEKRRK